MITASKDKLRSYFQTSAQYKVPFFQRAYIWTEENWESLWENIFQVYSDAKDDKKSEHFIGTIITKQRPAAKLGEDWHDLIDGQQRLTTISLLLKGLSDSCNGELPKLRDEIDRLLVYEDARGEKCFRMELCKNDMPYFKAIVEGGPMGILNSKENAIIQAYKYFKDKVKDFGDENLAVLENVILERVPVISMLLSSDDDEQVIFDTINSLGVKLTTAELLKNFIFQDKTQESLYERLWEPTFEEDEKTVQFWNKGKTSGRIIRTNIEVLLYCYLIIETKKEIRLDHLYKEYKDWLAKKTVEERTVFLENLIKYADTYYRFPEGEELNEIAYAETEKRFFHIIENLSITTVFPLVLYIYREVTDPDERNSILELLESYLVRRNICRLTTKNYNNLFISMIQILDKAKNEGQIINRDIFKKILESFTEDTNKFPNDTEFKDEFLTAKLSNQNSREILFCIALNQRKSPMSDIKKLSSSSYSIEHMMPIKWKENWMTPDMDEQKTENRDKALRTLGNLTLVTRRLNSKLSNAAWIEKKETLKKYSSLSMTVDYLPATDWNEEKITLRADDLLISALDMWRYFG